MIMEPEAMKTFLLAAVATLSLGVGAAFAQGAPAELVNPQLGAPWTMQKLAEQAAHDRAVAASQSVIPDAQRNARLTTSTVHGG
jgi:ABC-type sugar transport system substrate-binding protein